MFCDASAHNNFGKHANNHVGKSNLSTGNTSIRRIKEELRRNYLIQILVDLYFLPGKIVGIVTFCYLKVI